MLKGFGTLSDSPSIFLFNVSDTNRACRLYVVVKQVFVSGMEKWKK